MATPAKINSLALLGLKCGSNVFDLSSDMANISIRDQVVRARLLVRDLANLPERPAKVLVVGAGFAGVSAALACIEAGIGVTVVEANDEPFKLQLKRNERWVGPLIYEWPMHNSDDQTYPPSVVPPLPDTSLLGRIWGALKLGPEPMEAEDLAKHATQTLRTEMRKRNFAIYVDVDPATVTTYVHAFHQETDPLKRKDLTLPAATLWPSGGPQGMTNIQRPDAIILGGGVGQEIVWLDKPPEDPSVNEARGAPFWSVDGWLSAAVSADDEVGVFGGGDGALQDALRALTGRVHPQRTLRDIRAASSQAEAALLAAEPELLAVELESRLAATWTPIW
ncbi:MAG: FAD-binding oxidoreductase, partial [Chloroflexota bacterium]|nr:FAD-binding oxidoreductase [Chloroflexota bacterium]